MQEKGWFVILNPVAGGRKGQKVWDYIRTYLEGRNEPFTVEKTNATMHATEIAKQAVLNGYRKLYIIGGDGTLNETVNGVLSQSEVPTAEITIGMCSIGTGNDFIKTVGIPKDYKKAIQLLDTGKPRLLDTGIAYYQEDGQRKSRYFINVAGMAFDAAITQYANRNKKAIGKIQYMWSLVRNLFVYQSTHIKLDVDGTKMEDTGFCVNVGNCRYAGGGMMIVPQAIPDDGLFHVTFITDISKINVVRNIVPLFTGTFISHPAVHVLTGKNVKVNSEPLCYLEVEGETLGHSPFEFQIQPGSIKVLVP